MVLTLSLRANFEGKSLTARRGLEERGDSNKEGYIRGLDEDTMETPRKRKVGFGKTPTVSIEKKTFKEGEKTYVLKIRRGNS